MPPTLGFAVGTPMRRRPCTSSNKGQPQGQKSGPDLLLHVFHPLEQVLIHGGGCTLEGMEAPLCLFHHTSHLEATDCANESFEMMCRSPGQ